MLKKLKIFIKTLVAGFVRLISKTKIGVYGFEQTAVGFQTLYSILLEGIANGLGLILFSSIICIVTDFPIFNFFGLL